jgi:hypothetical protein
MFGSPVKSISLGRRVAGVYELDWVVRTLSGEYECRAKKEASFEVDDSRSRNQSMMMLIAI